MLRSWVEVSLDRIAANYRAVKETVGDVEVMPVVKADAYRHGASAVAHRLEEEGVRWLAVSNVGEGVRLREDGLRSRILVMADTLAAGADAWRTHRLTPVLHRLEDIAALPAGIRYHLKIDSGMSRLGVRASAGEIVRAVRGTPIEGVMTHFASAANFASGQTAEQVAAFEEVVSQVDVEYVHLSSTSPIHFGLKQTWRNLVRPGLALYGYVSAARGTPPGELLRVSPALTWKARILLVKDVPAGALIGYGGLAVAAESLRLAIIGAGYADGIPHRLSNRGHVLAGGERVPMLGAVSMDVATLDISRVPHLRIGDEVTLLGEGLDAQAMARTAGTIAYAVLCGINSRVSRVFV
ncbi:MAG: alanine racemase [Bryobacteraceae bacterium]|nr:alanine racemase [Bryobacteraceae bacterium]